MRKYNSVHELPQDHKGHIHEGMFKSSAPSTAKWDNMKSRNKVMKALGSSARGANKEILLISYKCYVVEEHPDLPECCPKNYDKLHEEAKILLVGVI